MIRGCFNFIVLFILALIVIGAYFAWKSSDSKSENNPPTSPAATVLPLAPSGMKQTHPSTSPQVTENPIDAAAYKLEEATNACLDKLKSSLPYKNVEKEIILAKTRVDAAPQSPDVDEVVKSNKAYIELLETKSHIETQALRADPRVKSARDDLNNLKRKNYQLEQSYKAQQRIDAKDQIEREREAENQEAQRIANDPINRAISQHRLIRGMNYDQAIASIGRPYAITDAGEIVSATWNINGIYWSATFVDDKATNVSVMAP